MKLQTGCSLSAVPFFSKSVIIPVNTSSFYSLIYIR